MKRLGSFFVIASVAFGAACDDGSVVSPRSVPGPSMAISDGAHGGGNPDFFFLPPLVPNPKNDPNFDAGGFHGGLAPTVSVCLLADDPATDPATDCVLSGGQQTLVASFPSGAVGVSVSDQHYQVNWHTDQSNLSPSSFYRIQVFVGSTRVGFADVDPLASAKELRNARTGDIIPLVDGRTLPIRFRIEQGVLCENRDDCGVFRVTNDGGTFKTNTGFAGVRFLPGFLPDGVEEVVLTVERVVIDHNTTCHGPLSARLWKEFEGCYSFRTDPDLAAPHPDFPNSPRGFRQRTIVARCSELSPQDPLYGLQQGFKSKDGQNLQRLPNVVPPPELTLECAGFREPVIGAASGPMMRLLAAGLRRVGGGVNRLLGVRPLYAVDLGLGDMLDIGNAFSNINWAIALDAHPESDNGELQAGFGLPLAQPLSVHVSARHEHADEEVEEHAHVAGVMVTFEVTEGDGHFGFDVQGLPMRIALVPTNVDGTASVQFTTASNDPVNVVTASATTLDDQPVTLQITGLPSDLTVENLALSAPAADQMVIGFDVANIGNGVAVPSVASVVISSAAPTGPPLSQVFSAGSIAPEGRISFTTAPFGPLPPGDYTVTVTADANLDVVESSDANNTVVQNFTVAADLEVLSGEWVNEDPNTGSITRFVVAVDGQAVSVEMWGSCSPTDCEWGTETANTSNWAGMREISLFWDQGFATQTQTLAFLSASRLRLTTFTEFFDESGREDFTTVDFFVRP